MSNMLQLNLMTLDARQREIQQKRIITQKSYNNYELCSMNSRKFKI